MAFSTKVLSYDHAFGYILNSLESKRIEILGLKEWEGMENELIFNEGISWLTRPLLNSLYGKQKIIEAFSQYLLTGYVKGELFGSELDRVRNAVNFGNEIVREALDRSSGTDWLERHIPQIIKLLQINPLVTIPLTMPKSRIGLSLSANDLVKQIQKISQKKTTKRHETLLNH